MTTEQQKAASDISVIKEALDNTKTNNKLLQWLFLLSGIKNIFFLTSITLLHLFVSNLDTIGVWYIPINIVCYVFIAAAAIKITYIARRSSNKYCITYFSIYSAVVILMPLILLVTRIMSGMIATDSNAALISLNQLSTFLEVALFSGALITVGVLGSARGFSVASILNILIYLLLYVSDKTLIWGEVQTGTISSDYSSIYYTVIISFGYIILGIYLLVKNKRNAS